MLTKTASSKNKYKNIVKYYYNFKKLYSMLLYLNMHFKPVMEKIHYSGHYSSLQSFYYAESALRKHFLLL